MSSNNPSLKDQFLQARAVVSDQLRKLSLRERLMALGAVIAVLGILAYMGVEYATEAFAAQAKQRTEIELNMNRISEELVKYVRLRARQQSIEEAYREVEIKEGVLSHLENLVREKAGIASGFTIKEKPIRKLGDSYEQVPFSVEFTIVDLSRLKDFLEELVYGPRPLILASINLKRKPAGDAVTSIFEIISIRKLK